MQARAIDRMAKRAMPHEPQALGLDSAADDSLTEFPREMKERLDAVSE